MLVTPLACISLMMGRTLAANASLISLRAFMEHAERLQDAGRRVSCRAPWRRPLIGDEPAENVLPLLLSDASCDDSIRRRLCNKACPRSPSDGGLTPQGPTGRPLWQSGATHAETDVSSSRHAARVA